MFTNKHIVLFILIIIIVVFIYNYDVYVIKKNEPLCKPIYVVKRELTPELRAKLNKSEKIVFHETIDNIASNDLYEGFANTDLKVPDKSICKFVITELKDPEKIRVMDSVLNIIAYIPTPFEEKDLKEIISHYAKLYEKSDNIEHFYSKSESQVTNKNDNLLSCKFAQLIIFLIARCDIQSNVLSKDNTIKIQDEISEESTKQEIPQKILELVEKKIRKKLKKINKNAEQNQSEISKPEFNYSNDFNVEQIKTLGGTNLNDGPSSYELSDSVDRVSQSTRIGPYHHKELIYNDNKQNAGFYQSNFKDQMDNYVDRSKDYLNTETCASDNYNGQFQTYNIF